MSAKEKYIDRPFNVRPLCFWVLCVGITIAACYLSVWAAVAWIVVLVGLLVVCQFIKTKDIIVKFLGSSRVFFIGAIAAAAVFQSSNVASLNWFINAGGKIPPTGIMVPANDRAFGVYRQIFCGSMERVTSASATGIWGRQESKIPEGISIDTVNALPPLYLYVLRFSAISAPLPSSGRRRPVPVMPSIMMFDFSNSEVSPIFQIETVIPRH